MNDVWSVFRELTSLPTPNKSLTITVKQRRSRTPSRSLGRMGQEQGGAFNGNPTGFAGFVHCGMASRPHQSPCLTLTLVGLKPYSPPNAKPQCSEQQKAATQQAHQDDLFSEECFPCLCHPLSLSFIEKRGREGRRGKESREEEGREEEERGEREEGESGEQRDHTINQGNAEEGSHPE